MQYNLHINFDILDNGPYWISYDDQESVELKAQYANLLNLAGCFGWSLETDDFEGRYFDETYPLLRVCACINVVYLDDFLKHLARHYVWPTIMYWSL